MIRPHLNGAHYMPFYINKLQRQAIIEWLETLHPIWEQRFSTKRPVPAREEQRWLKRPVYWLGNWQFACLNYYTPPKGTMYRCIKAEPYPPCLQEIVDKIHKHVRQVYPKSDVPPGWELNTCLINFYGDVIEEGKKSDQAKVGDHRDHEPGPVASLSLGESAFFQFVGGKVKDGRKEVVFQKWLEDSSMQFFAGKQCKEIYFHRVQRVERKKGLILPPSIENFETRRINFTFRYVPREHIFPLNEIPLEQREDIVDYVDQLAKHSQYWQEQSLLK